MTTSLNVSGTWKTLSKVWINVSGTWKECTKVWLNVGGTWKEVFTNGSLVTPIAISLTRTTVPPTNATSGITFNTDGSWTTTGTFTTGSNVGWFSPTGGTPGNSYWIKAVASGDTPSGTLNTVLALSSNRGWTLTESRDGEYTKTCTLTIYIYSDSGGTNLVATWTVTLTSTVTSI